MSSTPYADQPAAPTLADTAANGPHSAVLDTSVEPEDFDTFWKQTIDDTRTDAADLTCQPQPTPLHSLTVENITFPGYAAQPVHGWLITPAAATGSLPVIVQYAGYGDGRGDPLQHLLWASCGYAHFVMDNRGQGEDTPDPLPSGGVPAGGSDGAHVTRGITDPANYHYRRLITDAVRAVDCLPLHPRINPDRIVLAGASQGGGLALAAAALSDGAAALLCDIPFMTAWRHATHIADRGPYADIAALCRSGRINTATVFATLAYFDGRSFAARAAIPALFSVALMDRVCPPSTVQAAYTAYAGPKDLRTYEFNDHEGPGLTHTAHQLAFLDNLFRTRRAH